MRWSHYNLMPKYCKSIKQPSGDFCWYCDGNQDSAHPNEQREEIITSITTDPDYKKKWIEEERPLVVADAKRAAESGNLRRKRRPSLRMIEVSNQSAIECFQAGNWIDLKKYKDEYGDPKKRKHTVDWVVNPETRKRVKAVFVPTTEPGVWSGKIGNKQSVVDRSQVARDDEVNADKMDEVLEHHQAKQKTCAPGRMTMQELLEVMAAEKAADAALDTGSQFGEEEPSGSAATPRAEGGGNDADDGDQSDPEFHALQQMEARKRARLGLGGGTGAAFVTPRKPKLVPGIAHGGGPPAAIGTASPSHTYLRSTSWQTAR
jgi:hypothetical protein